VNVTVCEGRVAGVFCAVTNKPILKIKAGRKKRAVWIGKIAERKRSNFVCPLPVIRILPDLPYQFGLRPNR